MDRRHTTKAVDKRPPTFVAQILAVGLLDKSPCSTGTTLPKGGIIGKAGKSLRGDVGVVIDKKACALMLH